MDLTISIVSYNTRDWLRRCLRSIYKHTKNLSFEIVVVDNASTEGSAQMVAKEFSQVRLIKNKTNRWYTGANNQALKLARGKYFLILNSDIYLKNNAFKTMVEYLDQQPRVGAIEPLQQDDQGRVVRTASDHNRARWDLAELTLLHKFLRPPAAFRLAHLNRRKIFAAEVISDAAMMLRTRLFKKLGGYDTRFKLYYTENDLCRRIQRLGFKTIHLGTAAIRHRISASTEKVGWQNVSKIYSADCRQYYIKYQSRLTANLLYLALKLNNFLIWGKDAWPWLSLVVLATILRFWRLPETMTFIGDQGRDYLAARDMVLTGQWPLVGIASSIPWLHQGPLFIWLTALMLKIGNFNPVTPAILTAVLGVLSVYLLYRLSRSWWAGLILATAPLAVIHSRLPYHLSPIPLVMIGYLWALTIASAGWAVFFASLLLQFELSNLPVVFLTIFWFRKDWLKLVKWSPVGLIPFIPKIIYDFSHGFTQTAGLVAWTGYRLVSWRQYGNASGLIFEFWTKFIAPGYPLIAAVLGVWLVLRLIKAPRAPLLALIFMLAGFFIHGQPSEGYFLVLFPVWAWLLSRINKYVLLALAIFSVIGLFTHNFYPYGPTLRERLRLVNLLPEKFQLVNFSQNPGWASYLDDYRYLIWWRGKDYQSEDGPVYSIYDGAPADFRQELGTTVFHLTGQKLIKYD